MKKGLTVLAGLAVLAAAVVPLCLGAEKKEVRPEKPRREKPKHDKKEDPFSKQQVAFGEDVAQLEATVGLTDEQKKKLGQIKESRDKAVAKFEKSYGPRISKAEEKLSSLDKKDRRTAPLRKQLEGFLHGARMNREKLEAGYAKRMFAVLTPEQRAKWNTPILKEEMMKEFSLLFLDAKQEERLESLCGAQAKRLSVPLEAEKHAKSLDGVKMQVYRSILTKKQQSEYRKLKAALDKKKGGGREGGPRKRG